MDSKQVREWRGRRTQATAGAAIGKSERQIRNYESGRDAVGKTVEMAMCADALGITYIEEANNLKKSLDEENQ